MRATLRMVAACALTLGFTACDDGDSNSDNGGGTGGTGGMSADMGVAATGLTLDTTSGTVAIGESLTLVGTVAYSDGSSNAEGITWASSDAAVATVAGGVVTAVAPGEVTITATFGDFTAEASITVAAAVLDRIEVSGPGRANVGDTLEFSATAHFSDGSTEPLAGATFTVSDPRVLDLDGASAEAIAGGPVTVQVAHEGLTGEWSGTVKCGEYPFYQDVLRAGSTAPPLNWTNAYRPDGTQFHFSLDDARCFADYADKDLILVVMGAGWCPACTQWTLLLDRWLTQMPNVEVVHVISQTADFGDNATSDYAQAHVARMIGDSHGIRVGGVDTRIEGDEAPNFIHFQDFIEFFPTTFVVRKRDMRVLTDSLAVRGQLLPISTIAADPEADWSRPPRIEYTGYACADGDDEASEPGNNFYASAAVIGAGTHEGAICDAESDYYRIDIEGPWRATLRFENSVGDLAVYAYQPRRDGSPGFEPIEAGGELVGSDTTEDVETFEHQGVTTIGISGFLGSVGGRYTLEVEAL